MKAIINGKIILKDQILENKVIVFDNKIVDITDEIPVNCEIIDAKGMIVSPGLIDIHIHGSGGMDTMYATEEAIKTISNTICKNGVTSYLPTTMTMSESDIKKALDNIKKYMNENHNGSSVIGVHMEGPFINSIYKGAQNSSYVQKPNFDLIRDYIDILKIVSYAPEEDDNFEFTKKVKRDTDIILSICHTNATYEQAKEAIALGVSNITHTFNGMTGLNHRNPGVVGAALLSDTKCEIIADTIHVKKDLFQFFIDNKGKDNVVLITDAMEAAGLEDGEYKLGGQRVIVKDNCARLENGSLAGSIATLNRVTYNYYKNTNLSINEAINLSSLNPAKSINIDDKKGSLEIGKDADIAIFDESLNCYMTIVEGKTVFNKMTDN